MNYLPRGRDPVHEFLEIHHRNVDRHNISFFFGSEKLNGELFIKRIRQKIDASSTKNFSVNFHIPNK